MPWTLNIHQLTHYFDPPAAALILSSDDGQGTWIDDRQAGIAVYAFVTARISVIE
jgi:hypothetical protein